MNLKKKDDGVSNVVGEMLLLAIAVVLVSVFAMSFFGIMPGERAEVIEFDGGTHQLRNTDYDYELGFQFQHIWGDFIAASDVRVIVYDGDSTEPICSARWGVTDADSQLVDAATKATLDLGDYVVVWFNIPTDLSGEHTFTFVITGPRGILETKTMVVSVS
ncbi:MAG TPA: type IV pilin N-terminal domain-containing protein [Methanocorpusculum sp.]|nr:type IV pilin N-terminal domain-containing protein [Methanocorpusculum sp.]HJJ40260.1 type IV pilin N-terminal domain-containing protein [Methanocorpusculum sp.]HJJ49649.1 type IV pilin N-terminal domain-containing protein [Methanocorpusculum sp.]HJJ57793.1 type IV pilin N-terminal domain-containing protein [Methanocorpusculum sp.]